MCRRWIVDGWTMRRWRLETRYKGGEAAWKLRPSVVVCWQGKAREGKALKEVRQGTLAMLSEALQRTV